MVQSTFCIFRYLIINNKSIFSYLAFIYELLDRFYLSDPAEIYNSLIANYLEEMDNSLKFYIEPHSHKKIKFSKGKDYDYMDDVLKAELITGYGTNENIFKTTITPIKNLKEYEIFIIEFHRVETPFIIGIWIFFASLAKIGNMILIFGILFAI